jgi:Concanavalin A-like lectin/glucanases superfamily/Domain of unknown function (DUF4214)/PKD domain
MVTPLRYIIALAALICTSTSSFAQTDTTVGEAQTIARLYSASLDRPPFTNGLNFFIDSFESGRTVISIAEDFVLSDEFVAKYGELDDVAYVERLFLNVLGRPGAQSGIDFWVGNLNNGQSRAFVLARFADSDENIAKTGILYDSMAFVDGQWQYSQVDSVIRDRCGNPGCLQTELNGAVGGASIVVAPLRDLDTISATASSLDEAGLRSLLGGFFDDMSSLDGLQLLGIFAPIQVQSGQLYLLTATDGLDFDNDQNRLVDDSPAAVSGQLHAIVTGEQLASGLQVNVMTEAAYQSLFDSLDSLSDEQVLQGLDDAAARLVKNINRDDTVDYLDVLAWRRLFDNDNIRTDLTDVNRLATALGAGQDAASLQILSNRMLGGAAAVGLDETSAVSISPDGTCDGRGRTIINRNQESITTVPPTDVCGDEDTGRVESSQSDVVGTIIPGNDGLATNTRIRRHNDATQSNEFEFSAIDPATSEITVDYTDTNGNLRRGNVRVSSTDAPDELSRRYRSLQDDSVEPEHFDKNADKTVSIAAAPQFGEILSESMSYGALVSNFTACVVSGFVAQFEASGKVVFDPDVKSWALAGCTSTLAEVSIWADERTPEQIIAFEGAVPELDRDGCSECFSYIASPLDGSSFEVGQSIAFNGVAPASSTSVFWDFGDGETSDSRAPFHAYSDLETYLAEFSVEYSDGSFAVNQVLLAGSLPAQPTAIGHWRFEEGPVGAAASVITDSSGNGLDMELAMFQPTSSVYAEVPNPNSSLGMEFLGDSMFSRPDDALFSTSSLTIEAFVRYDVGTGLRQILYRGNSDGGKDPYYLAILNGVLRFNISDGTTDVALDSGPLIAGEFMHVAGTLDDATDTMRVFVNGIQVGMKSAGGRRPTALLPGARVSIGGLDDGSSQAQKFDGNIDEVRLSNVALDPDEFLNSQRASVASPARLTLLYGP